ncbi:nonsense-mediated mrna decay protein [Stemphylium lycopersici]|uniref:Nonsense-mediated mrna decay protein n=1 Tax=Stemphylium lycopersici TaxID=183478 RepID=A0A364N071_STELY|nr:nonsense-mediated mrna decay protein [Stemphylium lycopersici]RAR08056.1 nonsense-mediated mrna decay protein [Stemphylium lycopersici]
MAPQPGPNGGVLPVTLLQKNTPTPTPTPRGPKAAQPRLKLICRRLPPGLTKSEFVDALGDEWKVGSGKIDWMKYRKGKISNDCLLSAAKPSKPARAYVHVTKQEHVKALGDHVRALTLHDATKSWQDPALVGPPSLEYAPYPKMPGGRRRNDNRQGTIDQDQEFKDFLESLTNPIAKPPAAENEGPKDKVKTTPLIEALREKKASRDKPNTKANRQARGDAKEDGADRGEKKILAKSGKENAPNAGDKNRRATKADKAQATKDAVKILNKEASSKSSAAAASNEKSSASPAPERKRGNVALAKSMLQRDLGVGPAPNRRRGTKREVGGPAPDAVAQPKETKASDEKSKETPVAQPAAAPTLEKSAQGNRKERPTRAERRAFKANQGDKANEKASATDVKTQTPLKTAAPQILKKPQAAQTQAPPKGPAASRAPPTEPAAARNSPTPAKTETTPAPPASNTPKAAPASPAPAPTSKQAFLKHANPSQGITEPLIEEAMKVFGGIDRVEIDKRKGFAYVDFAEPEGLQKAMAASPIKIAQGAVQVLERKEKVARNPRFNGPPTGPARGGGRGNFAPRGGRGGRGGARGGAHAGATQAAGAGDSAPAPAVASADAAT